MDQVNVLLNYSNLTEEYLVVIKEDYVTQYELISLLIVDIPNNDLTWSNLVQPFIDLDNRTVNLAILDMKDFYTDDKIRTKASELSSDLSKWGIEQSMRKDIYHKYKYYFENQYQTEKMNLSTEQQTHFENIMISYKIRGMDLSNDKFEELKQIKKTISELKTEFSRNLVNENYSENITKDLLIGLPDKFITDREQMDGTVKITLKYPDIVPIMEYAQNRELRKRISTLFKSRCMQENTPLVEKTFELRAKMAELFEFDNYSDYKLQKSMAENTTNVNQFLSNLLIQIKPLLKSDLDILKNLAAEDGIEKLESYDIGYYSRIYTEKTCQFNKQELKKYFPVEKVVSGTLQIYQQLLSFRFEKLTDYQQTLWHETVELYQVSDSNSGKLIGYFYLDLYPREGKYGHAACFPFITKSAITLPVATMACNFGKGNLTFDEVETFFHEFGHVMHHLCSESTIKDTSSFTCEHDFVETPSQMFEEWCYSAETLKMMSDNLPDEMVLKLDKSRKLFQGFHYARQLLFSHFDMFVHSNNYLKSGKTPKELFDKLHREIIELDPMENTSEPANFGHLMGGYDAGYYGYAWSLVYAKDLFSKFKNEGLLNPELGMKLRKEVLAQGSMRKSMDSIKIFLERDPSNEEFIRSIS